MKIYIYIIIIIFHLFPCFCMSGQWKLVDDYKVFANDTEQYAFFIVDFKCADSLNCISFLNMGDAYPWNRVTTDGGITWSTTLKDSAIFIDSSNGKKYRVYNPSKIRCAAYPDTNLCIAACDSQFFWRSSDKGQSWSKIRGNIDTSLIKYPINYIHFYNDRFGAIILGTYILFTTQDGGLNWSRKYYNNTDSLPPKFFIDVLCPELNLIKVLACDLNYYQFLITSTDGGDTWERGDYLEKKSNLGNNFLYFLNKNIGWCCGSEKVANEIYKEKIYHTSDGGKTWETQLDTLRKTKRYGLHRIIFTDENYGVAMGLGYKMWKTSNGGKTWIAVIDTPTYKDVFYDIAFPTRNTLFYVTIGYVVSQIWKYEGNFFSSVSDVPTIQNIDITLYPNPLPAGEPLNMKLWLDSPLEAELSIYNYLGQLMDRPRRQFLNAGESTLQYSDYGYFPSGAYCIVIKIGSRAFTKSFVVY